MILLLDNFDSFTHMLASYLRSLGAPVKVLRNNEPLQAILQGNYKAVVLSPGPGRPTGAGVMMQVIAHYYNKLPVLGICLGHQALGQYFGATVSHAGTPMHGKLSQIHVLDNSGIYKGLGNEMQVVRYHSLVVKNLPAHLRVTAQTQSGQVMSMEHVHHNITGIQYHPEAALTTQGLEILKNWLNFRAGF